MNHLNKQISEFGIECVRDCWKRSGLRFGTKDGTTGLYWLESPNDHKDYLTKIMTKASDKKKFDDYIFGMNEESEKKLQQLTNVIKTKIMIVHVDIRTNSIGWQYHDELMKQIVWNGITFPYIESNPRLGRLIYWSSFSLINSCQLSGDQITELVKFRTKNSVDKNQKSIFDV